MYKTQPIVNTPVRYGPLSKQARKNTEIHHVSIIIVGYIQNVIILADS